MENSFPVGLGKWSFATIHQMYGGIRIKKKKKKTHVKSHTRFIWQEILNSMAYMLWYQTSK